MLEGELKSAAQPTAYAGRMHSSFNMLAVASDQVGNFLARIESPMINNDRCLGKSLPAILRGLEGTLAMIAPATSFY
jgi:hypothetical protein